MSEESSSAGEDQGEGRVCAAPCRVGMACQPLRDSKNRTCLWPSGLLGLGGNAWVDDFIYTLLLSKI